MNTVISSAVKTFRVAPPSVEARPAVGHDVFISYSTKDQAAADAICDGLQASGVRCWIASRHITAGAPWAESIVNAITGCRLLVLVFSENANASKQVAREIGIADDLGLPIAPVRISDAKLTKTLQFYLTSSQWLNAQGQPLERVMPDLVTRVRDTLGVPPAPTAAPRPAPSIEVIERTPEALPSAAPTTGPAAAPAPAPAFTNSLGGCFIRLEPGEFMMGSPENEIGRGEHEMRHRVTLTKTCLLAVTQVTQAQWSALMPTNPSCFKGNDRPVETVSWDEATKFCEALSRTEGRRYRLPTEAEWEYACRAGTTTRFHAGDGERALADAAWYEANSGKQTHGVALKEPNAWGFHDMHGNVWEWCFDQLGGYPTLPVTDPQGAIVGSSRILRGGSWNDPGRCCRAAYRNGDARAYRRNTIGFRLALDLPV